MTDLIDRALEIWKLANSRDHNDPVFLDAIASLPAQGVKPLEWKPMRLAGLHAFCPLFRVTYYADDADDAARQDATRAAAILAALSTAEAGGVEVTEETPMTAYLRRLDRALQLPPVAVADRANTAPRDDLRLMQNSKLGKEVMPNDGPSERTATSPGVTTGAVEALVKAAKDVDGFMRGQKAYERSGYGPKLRAALAAIRGEQA